MSSILYQLGYLLAKIGERTAVICRTPVIKAGNKKGDPQAASFETLIGYRGLAFRELEALTRFRFTVFLTLDLTAIAGQEASGFDRGTQGRFIFGQGL